MSFLRRKNHLPVDKRLVLVTGGSQGMGLAVAQALARKGASVVIVARTQSKLDTALEAIRGCALRSSGAGSQQQRFLAISADLTKHADVQRVFDETVEWAGGHAPDVVWACAGGATPGWFKDLTPETLQSQVDTNYGSVMLTAHAALNTMLADPLPAGAPKRHIIFTSSVLAFYALAGYNAYSPSKAAIRSLADGLRQECLLYDIDVHCVFPGTIYTPGFEEEQKLKPQLTKILEGADEGQTPEQVADACIRKLEGGQMLIVTDLLGAVMRAAAWGGSPRGRWVWDTIVAGVIGYVWGPVGWFMDGHVKKWKKEKGVPKSAHE